MGDGDRQSSFTRRLQDALTLSISTNQSDASRRAGSGRASAGATGGGGIGGGATFSGSGGDGAGHLRAPSVGAAITPNSAAAAAFDSALVTPGHSRGGSVNFGGAFSGGRPALPKSCFRNVWT